MKPLLLLTAVLEAAIGIGLLLSPSFVASLLLGSALDAPGGLVVGRVAGAALLALGVACWLGQHDGASRATRGLVAAMALYNIATAVVLAYGGLIYRLSGIGLWPTVVLHVALGAWCIACLRRKSIPQTRNSEVQSKQTIPNI